MPADFPSGRREKASVLRDTLCPLLFRAALRSTHPHPRAQPEGRRRQAIDADAAGRCASAASDSGERRAKAALLAANGPRSSRVEQYPSHKSGNTIDAAGIQVPLKEPHDFECPGNSTMQTCHCSRTRACSPRATPCGERRAAGTRTSRPPKRRTVVTRLFDVRGIGDVAFDDENARRRENGQFIQPRPIAAEEDNLRSLREEPLHDGRPQFTGRSGDHRDFVQQTLSHA